MDASSGSRCPSDLLGWAIHVRQGNSSIESQGQRVVELMRRFPSAQSAGPFGLKERSVVSSPIPRRPCCDRLRQSWRIVAGPPRVGLRPNRLGLEERNRALGHPQRVSGRV
jgi:hypothetical protein